MTDKKPKTEPTTTFLIYETTSDGVSLDGVGSEVAHSSDQALRLFFTRPANAGRSGVFTAISENARRLRVRKVEQTVKATLDDYQPPAATVTLSSADSSAGTPPEGSEA